MTDENDNDPVFDPLPSELNVTEDTPYGTLLINATASDIDRDDTLSYWITGTSNLLYINSR